MAEQWNAVVQKPSPSPRQVPPVPEESDLLAEERGALRDYETAGWSKHTLGTRFCQLQPISTSAESAPIAFGFVASVEGPKLKQVPGWTHSRYSHVLVYVFGKGANPSDNFLTQQASCPCKRTTTTT